MTVCTMCTSFDCRCITLTICFIKHIGFQLKLAIAVNRRQRKINQRCKYLKTAILKPDIWILSAAMHSECLKSYAKPTFQTQMFTNLLMDLEP